MKQKSPLVRPKMESCFQNRTHVSSFTLSWCSASTSVSQGVFLVYPWRGAHSRPPTPLPSCSLNFTDILLTVSTISSLGRVQKWNILMMWQVWNHIWGENIRRLTLIETVGKVSEDGRCVKQSHEARKRTGSGPIHEEDVDGIKLLFVFIAIFKSEINYWISRSHNFYYTIYLIGENITLYAV